jgi:A/G-specific adenine glycosylase
VAADYGGVFPDRQDALKALPGIGEYTSAAIAAIAFDRPATVIDGNIDRVLARYFAVEEPFPAGKKAVRHYAERLSAGRTDRPGDFAQAMMDLGATVCIPKAARCGICPLARKCRGRAGGFQNTLPRKAPPRTKPQKRGFVYWATDGKGRLLLERRPESAMMGGMMALPVSEWLPKGQAPAHDPRLAAVSVIRETRKIRVLHSFTHFDLELRGCYAAVENAASFRGPRYAWVEPDAALGAGLPSLFAKAIKLFTKKGHNDV